MGCTAVIHILGQSGITGGSLRSTQDDNCGDDDDDDVNGDEYDGCQFKDPLLLTQDDNGCDDHDIDEDEYNYGQLRNEVVLVVTIMMTMWMKMNMMVVNLRIPSGPPKIIMVVMIMI